MGKRGRAYIPSHQDAVLPSVPPLRLPYMNIVTLQNSGPSLFISKAIKCLLCMM